VFQGFCLSTSGLYLTVCRQERGQWRRVGEDIEQRASGWDLGNYNLCTWDACSTSWAIRHPRLRLLNRYCYKDLFSALQILPQNTAATMEVGLTIGAQLALLNLVTTANHGALRFLTVTTCLRNTLSSGEVGTSVVTQEARCRHLGASPWTLRSGWTCVTSLPAVSTKMP